MFNTSLSTFVFKAKQFAGLLEAIGLSLVELGCVNEVPSQNKQSDTVKYSPKPEETSFIIEKIRAELLEVGKLTDDVVCLTVLLSKSNIISDYFSKTESASLNKRLDEVKDSEAYKLTRDVFDIVMAAPFDLWH